MTNDVIAEGPPPLSREAADSSIDLIDFMAAVVRGVDLIDVTPDMRRRWVAHLTTYYPMLQPMDRYWFATADATLANLSATWNQAPPQMQEMARQSWAQPLAAVLQFASPVIGQGPATVANPFPAPMSAPAQSYPAPAQSFPAPTQAAPAPNGMRSGGSMADMMSRILAEQKAAEDEALQMGGEQLRQQVEMGNQATNIQTLTNIAAMRQQAMMAVAKNMKF